MAKEKPTAMVKARDEGYIKAQCRKLKALLGIEPSEIKAADGRTGESLLADLNEMVAAGLEKKDKRLIEAAIGMDPLITDRRGLRHEIAETPAVKARQFMPAVEYIGPYNPMLPEVLSKIDDVDYEEVKNQPVGSQFLEYPNPVVTNLGYQVATGGGVETRQIRFNRVGITVPAPTVSDKIPLNRQEWEQDLGAEAIRIRNLASDSVWMTLDGDMLDGIAAVIPDGSTTTDDNLEEAMGGSAHESHIVLDDDGPGASFSKLIQATQFLSHYGTRRPWHESPVDKIIAQKPLIQDFMNLGRNWFSEATAEEYFKSLISGRLLGGGENSGIPLMKNRLRQAAKPLSTTNTERHFIVGPPEKVGGWCFVTENGQTSYLSAEGWGEYQEWFNDVYIVVGSRVIIFIANRYATAEYRLRKRTTAW